MTKILGIIIIILGGYLFTIGLNRQDSLVGHADSAATSVANSVDGGTRTPKHTGYMVAGGALVLVGVVISFRRSKP
jgi:drug/metabolite transporter (DMT)-like permease